MVFPLLVAKGEQECLLFSKLANRHGLIAGAAGTGKTISMQVLAEKFSRIGVSVFMSDLKGDFSGISQPGSVNPKIQERIEQLGLEDFEFTASPVTFWDVFGVQGRPLRATVSDIGPMLLSRLLNLNDTQTGVLGLVFKIADDNGLLLLDLKDLCSMLHYVGDNAQEFQNSEYGSVSAASIGAIQRGLLVLKEQGGDQFFGEPALNLDELLQTDSQGRGVINVLAADQLMRTPQLYSTFLLWLLAELFEQLPEVGDLEKPKLVFFMDEAHLLFKKAPKALQDKIEQVLRLIRSKGVGVYFICQNSTDIPNKVLGQLGNRIQHALRGFTPRDQKAIKALAQNFRSNPKLEVETIITELEVGEALVSFLDERGVPGVVERAFICPPQGKIGAITPEQRQQIIQQSVVYGHYEKEIDRESAYEIMKARGEQTAQASAVLQKQPKGCQADDIWASMAKCAVRAADKQRGRQIIRGGLGSILGGRR